MQLSKSKCLIMKSLVLCAVLIICSLKRLKSGNECPPNKYMYYKLLLKYIQINFQNDKTVPKIYTGQGGRDCCCKSNIRLFIGLFILFEYTDEVKIGVL